MSFRFLILIVFFLIFLLFGCTAPEDELEPISEPVPTPTTFSLFEPGDESMVENSNGLVQEAAAVPTVASLFGQQESPTPGPSPVPLPTLAPYRPVISQPDDEISFTIFADELSSDWKILEDIGSNINMVSELHVYEGEKSIAFTPEADYKSLFFAVQENARTVFRAEDVIGVSFWLNGGDDLIALDELAISIIGSDDYTYWNPDDTSIKFPPGETFSETRLYYLGLNRSIPPDTWVEVYLPLDRLIYDPVYNYIVGFYLKNDEGFRNTVYLDNIRLILRNDIEEVVQEAGNNTSQTAANIATDVPQSGAAVTPTDQPEQGNGDIAANPTPINEANETPTPGAVENESSDCVVSPPDGWEIYAMKADDVLFNLTVERNLALEVVLRVNCLEESDVFSIGQNIWLPPLSAERPEVAEPTPAEPIPAEPSP